MVYYINNYYNEGAVLNREPISSLASNNKIKYIHYLLNVNNIKYINVSFGFTKTKGYSKKFINGNNMVYLPCISFSNKNSYNLLSIIFVQLYLILFILKNVKRDDIIILYHHPWITPVFSLVKRVKGFKLLLEIEEICFKDSSKNKIKAIFYSIFEKKIIKLSDSFIVVNDLIKNYVENIKPGISENNILVCYGNYALVEKFRSTDLIKRPDDSQSVKILYSGSIDKVRGAFEVIELFKALNDDGYIIYITGYGRNNDIKEFTNKIKELNMKKNKITFLGQLKEEDYLNLLQSVDVCLSCQNDKEAFAKYSFPSKIINYLSFNKIVVSSNMEAIKRSQLKDYIYFYDYNDIDSLKKIINDIKTKKQISRDNITNFNKILELNNETIKLFNELVKGENHE